MLKLDLQSNMVFICIVLRSPEHGTWQDVLFDTSLASYRSYLFISLKVVEFCMVFEGVLLCNGRFWDGFTLATSACL